MYSESHKFEVSFDDYDDDDDDNGSIASSESGQRLQFVRTTSAKRIQPTVRRVYDQQGFEVPIEIYSATGLDISAEKETSSKSRPIANAGGNDDHKKKRVSVRSGTSREGRSLCRRRLKIGILISTFVCLIVGLSTFAGLKSRSNKRKQEENISLQAELSSPTIVCDLGVIKDSHETMLELDLSGVSESVLTEEIREGYLSAVLEGYNKVSQGCDDEFERWMYGAQIVNQTLVNHPTNSSSLQVSIQCQTSCDGCPPEFAFASEYPDTFGAVGSGTNGTRRLYHIINPTSSSISSTRSTRSRNIQTRGFEPSFKTPDRFLEGKSISAAEVIEEIEISLFQKIDDVGFEGLSSATVHSNDGLTLVLRDGKKTSSKSSKSDKSSDECGKGKGKGKSKSKAKSTTSTTTSTTKSTSSKSKSKGKGKTDPPSSSLQPSMSSAPSCSLEPSTSQEPSSEPSITPSVEPTNSAEPSMIPTPLDASSEPSISAEPSNSAEPSMMPTPIDCDMLNPGLATVTISSCGTTISDDDTIAILNGDLSCSNQRFLRITGNNVILCGNDNTVSDTNVNNGKDGIQIRGNNVKIYDITLTTFDHGLKVQDGAMNAQLFNVQADANDIGITVGDDNVETAIIVDSTFNNNVNKGVRAQTGTTVTFRDSEACGNDKDLDENGSGNINQEGTTVCDSGNAGACSQTCI